MNPQDLRKWLNENGDKTHLLNHDLDSNSIVFDVGGFMGEFTEDIINKFNCNVYVFEPVSKYSNMISNKFKGNSKVKSYNFGLSDSSKSETIYINGDASSTHRNHQNKGIEEQIKLVSIGDFIKDNDIQSIDLLKINIEGEEFPLLEYLINEGLAGIAKNIQIQFHNWVDNAIERRSEIQNKLSETHNCTYDYEFVWENWKKK